LLSHFCHTGPKSARIGNRIRPDDIQNPSHKWVGLAAKRNQASGGEGARVPQIFQGARPERRPADHRDACMDSPRALRSSSPRPLGCTGTATSSATPSTSSGDRGDTQVDQSIHATAVRLCVRTVLCTLAFAPAPPLPSTRSAADCSALFAGFLGIMGDSDFSGPCITAYGSQPAPCGPSFGCDGCTGVPETSRFPGERLARMPGSIDDAEPHCACVDALGRFAFR